MMATALVLHVGEADFDAHVIERSRETPVLVDFWADWCGPCRALAPVLEQVVREHPKDLVLVKVDTEEHPGLARRFALRGMPTVKLFVGGVVVGEFMGVRPKGAIHRFLRDQLYPHTGEPAR